MIVPQVECSGTPLYSLYSLGRVNSGKIRRGEKERPWVIMCMSNLCLSTPLHSVFCVLLYVLACYVSEPATAAAEGSAIGAGEQEAKACQSWRVLVRRVCPLTTCILPFHESRVSLLVLQEQAALRKAEKALQNWGWAVRGRSRIQKSMRLRPFSNS